MHARSAVGMGSLPHGTSVEVEAIFYIDRRSRLEFDAGWPPQSDRWAGRKTTKADLFRACSAHNTQPDPALAGFAIPRREESNHEAVALNPISIATWLKCPTAFHARKRLIENPLFVVHYRLFLTRS
jgi:hypothetical protein